MDLRVFFKLPGQVARVLYGSEDLKLARGRIVSCDGKGCIARGFLLVRDFTEILEDLDGKEVQRILNSYVKILSQNAPIDLRVVVTPIKPEEVVSRIDRAIQVKQVMLETDPTNEKLRTEVERLRRIKKKVLSGEVPFSINMIFSVSSWGSTEDEALEKLSHKISLLREELRSIGIYTEDLRGLGAIAALNEFFREKP